MTRDDVLVVLGYVMVLAGLYLLGGPGVALVVGGAVLFVSAGMASARRGRR